MRAIILVTLSGAIGLSAAADVQALLAQATALMDLRYEPMNLWQIIDLYEQALALAPGRPDITARLAQFWYEWGVLSRDPEKKRPEAFEKAKDYAMSALRSDPEFVQVEKEQGLEEAIRTASDPTPLLWLGQAWGQLLGMIDPLTAFRDMPKVRLAYERVVELDPAFFGGTALHALGALTANLAANWLFSLITGINLAEAKPYFERAIELCPDFLENYVVYAREYATRANDRPLFEHLVRFVLAAPIGKWPFWNRIAKREAEELLARIDELFR